MTVITLLIFIFFLSLLAALAVICVKREKIVNTVLMSPDSEEVMAVIRQKTPKYLKYYLVELDVPAKDKNIIVQHYFTRNYIDNYRPEEVPVMYSEKSGLTATKGQHELKMFKRAFIILSAAAAISGALFVYSLI